jgi:glycosyltransferase involved in cell wall biosynthesis
MRFHVVALPHTQTTKDFANCAYTEKVRRFCNMMKGLGHTVYLYAGEENEAAVDELIPCITETQRRIVVGKKPYVEAPFDYKLPHWEKFNNRAIKEIRKRIQDQDFICLIAGATHKPIAEAFKSHISVEFGVGYSGIFSDYKVFESYAWMHAVYAQFKNAAQVDGAFFDAVIPGYLDPDMFPLGKGDGDYYLYIGRMIPRKGVEVAAHICKTIGARLIMAGPGNYIPNYGEYIGPVDAEKRSELMGGAIATFVPTLYLEPFGNVNIESQACGTPVITTDWGAFTETVVQGVTGYRCRSVEEFILATQNVKNLDRAAIRKRAVETYGVDVIAKQYEYYFQRLLTLWGDGWYEKGKAAEAIEKAKEKKLEG